MSKPSFRSVTPKTKSNQFTTPRLPPCSIPYRKKLYLGYGLSFYSDADQPPATWDVHRHPEAQILILGDGADCTLHWKQNGRWQSRDVKSAHVWILGPLVAHRLEWRKRALRAAIYVAPRFATETAGRPVRGSQIFDLNQVTSQDIQALQSLKIFVQDDQPKKAADVLKIKSAGTNLTVMLLQSLGRLENLRRPIKLGLSAAAFERIEHLIEQHIEDKLTICEMSRAVHMGVTTFHRQFKQRTGITPIQHLIGRRVAKASLLLCKDGCNISEIAFSLGFSSQSYFDRCFKKWRGCSPTQFRLLHMHR